MFLNWQFKKKWYLLPVIFVSPSQLDAVSRSPWFWNHPFIATQVVVGGYMGQLGPLLTVGPGQATHRSAPFPPKKANATDPQEGFWGSAEMMYCINIRAWCCQCLTLYRACWQEGEGRKHLLEWTEQRSLVRSGLKTWDLTLRGWFVK